MSKSSVPTVTANKPKISRLSASSPTVPSLPVAAESVRASFMQPAPSFRTFNRDEVAERPKRAPHTPLPRWNSYFSQASQLSRQITEEESVMDEGAEENAVSEAESATVGCLTKLCHDTKTHIQDTKTYAANMRTWQTKVEARASVVYRARSAAEVDAAFKENNLPRQVPRQPVQFNVANKLNSYSSFPQYKSAQRVDSIRDMTQPGDIFEPADLLDAGTRLVGMRVMRSHRQSEDTDLLSLVPSAGSFSPPSPKKYTTSTSTLQVPRTDVSPPGSPKMDGDSKEEEETRKENWKNKAHHFFGELADRYMPTITKEAAEMSCIHKIVLRDGHARTYRCEYGHMHLLEKEHQPIAVQSSAEQLQHNEVERAACPWKNARQSNILHWRAPERRLKEHHRGTNQGKFRWSFYKST